jgi:hypothetical protein
MHDQTPIVAKTPKSTQGSNRPKVELTPLQLALQNSFAINNESASSRMGKAMKTKVDSARKMIEPKKKESSFGNAFRNKILKLQSEMSKSIIDNTQLQ